MNEITLNELSDLIESVSKKQNNYVEKYCDNAPRFVVKNVLNLMFPIQRKIYGYKLISELYAEEYKYIKKNNLKNKLYKRIYNKVKKSVKYLKKNYYHSIVEDYIMFIYRVIEKGSLNDYQVKKIKGLVKSLELEEFIENHDEYYKILGIFKITEKVNEIKKRIYKEDWLDYCINNKEVFLDYEKILNKISKIKDKNLIRAVLYYLEIVSDFKDISLDR